MWAEQEARMRLERGVSIHSAKPMCQSSGLRLQLSPTVRLRRTQPETLHVWFWTKCLSLYKGRMFVYSPKGKPRIWGPTTLFSSRVGQFFIFILPCLYWNSKRKTEWNLRPTGAKHTSHLGVWGLFLACRWQLRPSYGNKLCICTIYLIARIPFFFLHWRKCYNKKERHQNRNNKYLLKSWKKKKESQPSGVYGGDATPSIAEPRSCDHHPPTLVVGPWWPQPQPGTSFVCTCLKKADVCFLSTLEAGSLSPSDGRVGSSDWVFAPCLYVHVLLCANQMSPAPPPSKELILNQLPS